MNAAELLAGIDWRFGNGCVAKLAHHHITDVITSPKTGCENALFVVTRSALSNGRYEMRTAYARGCRLFLCERDAYPGADATVLVCEAPERRLGILAARVYGHPSREMSVIGVTGSAGKSSVVLQAAQILRRHGYRVCTLDSDGTDICGKRTLPSPIVPDAADIQRALRKMADAGAQIALLELSSYQLAHHAAQGIDFTAVQLINLMPRHIGGREHSDFATYRAAKAALMNCNAAVAILPTDVAMPVKGKRLLLGKGGVLWDEGACIRQVMGRAPITSFLLCDGTDQIEVALPTVGHGCVSNALSAAAICLVLGLSLQEAAQGLSGAVVAGRMECVMARNGWLIYRDSAFLPEDLQNALQALRPLCTGRLCVLLGSVGGRAGERRAPLGAVAGKYADFVYLTADDPDAEPTQRICAQMLAGMAEPERACVIPEREAALLRAVRELRPGDVLLVIAKPYAVGQLVGGRYLNFCEEAVIRRICEEI